MKRHNPKHQYDCGNCKFVWNCGYLCACILKRYSFGEPPDEVKVHVNQRRAETGLTPPYMEEEVVNRCNEQTKALIMQYKLKGE